MSDSTPNQPASGDDPWMTVPQVAAQLSIHPATVRIWIKRGRLAAVRVGKEWRIRQSEVNRALLLEASPAYSQQETVAAGRPEAGSAPTPAPRQIADHIIAVAPRPLEQP